MEFDGDHADDEPWNGKCKLQSVEDAAPELRDLEKFYVPTRPVPR